MAILFLFMADQLEALLGINDSGLRRAFSAILGRSYAVTSVSTMEEMRATLNIVQGNGSLEQCRYAVVIMDANLGMPRRSTLESGKEIYTHLQAQIDVGRVHFMTMSGYDPLLQTAQAEGFPCVPKPDGIIEYIRALQK